MDPKYEASSFTIFQFGSFELDRRRRVLLRRGRRVRLSSSLMELLALFVSQPGELITREQIAQCLWSSPQLMDTTAGINTAVNRLRSALQDDAEKPTYIETVIGLGYRFIAEVRGVNAPPPGVAAAESTRQNGDTERSVAAAHVDASLTSAVSQPTAEPAELKTETAATLAASTSKEGEGKWRVVVLLLTLSLVVGVSILWVRRSSDGTTTTQTGSTASFGFQQITFNDEGNQVSASAVSHSGALLAFADPSGITVRLVGVGADRFVASPEGVAVDRLAWSHDDQGLVVSGTDVTTRQSQVWFVGLDGRPARSLVNAAADAIASPGSDAILFTREQRSELWMIGPGENSPHRVLAGKGDNYLPLTWIPKTDLIALRRCTLPNEAQFGSLRSRYQCTYAVLNVRRASVLTTGEAFDADSATVLPDRQVLLSQNHEQGSASRTQLDSAAVGLPTGMLRSAPTAAGTVPGFYSFSLSGSEDGREVALVVRRRASDIYSAELRNGSLEAASKLLHPAPDNYPHAWTADSQSVIYESTQSGRSWIYQQKPGDANATLLARAPNEGALPQLTPDGKWILFENLPADPATRVESSLYRIPHAGGRLEIVPTHGHVDDFYCSVSQTGICVLRETVNQQFVYYKLDPIKGQGAELARTERVESDFGDWSVSPDGRWVALPLHAAKHSGIRLVSLCAKARCTERDIPVSGAGEPLETTWDTGSADFYVESKRDTDFALLRVDQSGHCKLLTTSFASIWAVPSRDGRRLAYPGQTTSTNVWAVEKKTPTS